LPAYVDRRGEFGQLTACAATLCGVAVELDARGLAVQIALVRLGGKLLQARPSFWEKAGR
jgi:calcineurin-like phosphoesterase